MTDVKPSAAVEMTLLTKERPLVSEMKAWLEDNLTRLPPDQRALVMGVEPQGIYAFEPATVLPTLVVDAGTGITAPMKAARDAANQAILDANAVKAKRKAAFMAEVANNLFVGLERALKPNAPLLLNKFKKAYPQGAPYAKYNDGARAWAALEAMGKANAQLAGEAAASDARIVTYDLKRLPADATADASLRAGHGRVRQRDPIPRTRVCRQHRGRRVGAQAVPRELCRRGALQICGDA